MQYSPEEACALAKKFDQRDMVLVTGAMQNCHESLVAAHAYGLIGVTEYNGETLYEILNPHAAGEWTGAWADDSP